MKYIIRDQTFKKSQVLAIIEMFTMALMILPQFKAIFMLIPSPEWGRAPKMKKLDHLTNNEKKKNTNFISFKVSQLKCPSWCIPHPERKF